MEVVEEVSRGINQYNLVPIFLAFNCGKTETEHPIEPIVE